MNGNAQNDSCAGASLDWSMKTEDPIKDVSSKKNGTTSIKFVILGHLKNNIDKFLTYLMEHEKH